MTPWPATGVYTARSDEGIDAGYWGGQFFGNGEADGRPGSIGGTLGGRATDGSVTFTGIFGAYKQ